MTEGKMTRDWAVDAAEEAMLLMQSPVIGEDGKMVYTDTEIMQVIAARIRTHYYAQEPIDAYLASHPEQDDGLTEAYMLGRHDGRKDQSTNAYERAVIEQAMVTECVNIEGRDPTDIIRDIISWHVDMDRGARAAERPRGKLDKAIHAIDDLVALNGEEHDEAAWKLIRHRILASQPKAATDAEYDINRGWATIHAGEVDGWTNDKEQAQEWRDAGKLTELMAHDEYLRRTRQQEKDAAWDGVTDGDLHRDAPDAHHNIARAVWQYMNRRSAPGVIMTMAYTAVLRALASPSAPRVGVPEGWKLVPVEPTGDMMSAARRIASNHFQMQRVWEAMLAAAPEVQP